MLELQKLKDEEKYLFLKSLLDKEEFLDFIEVFVEEDYKVKFNPSFKLSEFEFQYIPMDFYKEIYDHLKFNELDASNYKNWFYVNLEAVKNDIIKPYYFAFSKKNKEPLRNITRALREYEKGEKKFFYEIFRAVLRRMFGMIKERGRKGIFQDVPFSIAWWKYHLFLISLEYVNNEKILEFLYEKATFYNQLVEKMGFTLTVLADRKLLAALLDYAAYNGVKKELVKDVAMVSSIRSFGALNVDEIQKIIKGL